MAANTITGQQILFKVARDVGELKAARITTYTSATSFICLGLTETTTDFYVGALLREVGGAVIGTISAYNGTTKAITLAGTGVTGLAAGDIVEFCWWNADKRAYAFAAINEAIRGAHLFWFRDVEETTSTATLVFDQDTYAYTLPSAVSKLLQIGVQPDASYPPYWFDPRLDWKVTGQEGAFTLVLLDGCILQQNYNAEKILLKYVTWEPELASETGTTQLPLDYFWTASAHYVENALNDASRLDLATANVNVPQIQRRAAQAQAQLQYSKPRIAQHAELKW